VKNKKFQIELGNIKKHVAEKLKYHSEYVFYRSLLNYSSHFYSYEKIPEAQEPSSAQGNLPRWSFEHCI